LSRYSNKIESVGLRKWPYYRYLIQKVMSTDVRITNISQSLPHKTAENNWYEEMTTLSPYVYADYNRSIKHEIQRLKQQIVCEYGQCRVV